MFLNKKRFAFILPVILLATSVAAIAQTPTLDEQLSADLKVGPCKQEERLEAVKSLFKRVGATDADIKVEKFKDIQNIVLSKKGRTDETVVIGAHYDKVSDGCGIIDNWSGIVILAYMYQTLGKMDTEKSYVFAAFDREEKGLQGSAAMVKEIPKESRANYCSMVNLDSFGLGYPVILENASSSKMVKLATALGKELKVTVTPLNIPGANSDSASFKDKDIPAITLSALSPKWPEYLHSPKDKFENVLVPSVRVGYLFGLEYIKKVEAAPCGQYK